MPNSYFFARWRTTKSSRFASPTSEKVLRIYTTVKNGDQYDSKLQVQILAGTFQKGTDFDKSSLMYEHQAARNALCSIVEDIVGGGLKKDQLWVVNQQNSYQRLLVVQNC